MALLIPSRAKIQVPACLGMPKGLLDPNRLLRKVQDANFNTQQIGPSEDTSTTSYSKSLQKSESGEEDFSYPDSLYLDTLSLEDFGFR